MQSLPLLWVNQNQKKRCYRRPKNSENIQKYILILDELSHLLGEVVIIDSFIGWCYFACWYSKSFLYKWSSKGLSLINEQGKLMYCATGASLDIIPHSILFTISWGNHQVRLGQVKSGEIFSAVTSPERWYQACHALHLDSAGRLKNLLGFQSVYRDRYL